MISAKAVLLVDDDESIRASLTYFFRKKTRAFRSVPTAEDALALLETENDWDAIISDFKLPGMDGIALLKHVHACLPWAKTALITAYANMDIVTEALRAGIHDFIPKPFKAATIADAITRMTSRSGAASDDIVLHTDDPGEGRRDPWREDLEFTIQKVTHQMNNAFTALRGKAELGLRNIPGTGREAAFNEILDILQRVEALNKELMSLGKALTPQPLVDVDVMTVIRRCVFDHAALWHEAGVRLQILNVHAGPFLASTCEEPLVHILDNIIINAIQGFRGIEQREKQITVAVASQGTHILVRLSDNGVGMDPETRSRACRNGFTTKRDGNGLGLFITQRLCRVIKAQLHLESTAGEGTTVTLILPAARRCNPGNSL